MTGAQRDDLIVVLSRGDPSQVRRIAAEYLQHTKPDVCDLSLYDFLKEKFETEGIGKKQD